jgi:hypothetical protein
LSQKTVPFPHPRDIVRVVQGDTYVVPEGRILTLREFVASGQNAFSAVLKVDGQSLFLARVDFGEIPELELGIVGKGGQVVTLESDTPSDPVVAIGFLVDG